jgi:hypothetical protein
MARTLDPFAPRHALISGATALFARANGDFEGEHEGLFDRDCRMLSRHRLLVHGDTAEHARTTLLAPQRAVSRSIVGWHSGEHGDAHGPELPEDCLSITVARAIGRGLVERVTIENHAMIARQITVELLLDADFKDAVTVGGDPELRPHVTREVTPEQALVIAARFTHRGRVHRRTTTVRIKDLAGVREVVPHPRSGFTLDVALDPKGAASFTVDRRSQAPRGAPAGRGGDARLGALPDGRGRLHRL